MRRDVDDWVQATLPRALAYARSLLRDVGSAEDAVHDCYSRLLAKADVYDLPRDGLKILLRSITNACIDRQSRQRMLMSLDAEGEPVADGIVDRRTADPSQEAIARELAVQIEEALGHLPTGQRAALHLSSIGYSLPEVAEMLGATHANARVLVHRARKMLEQLLGPFLTGGTP